MVLRSKQPESIYSIHIITFRTLRNDPGSIFPLLLTDERRKMEESLHAISATTEEAALRITSLEKKLTKISKDDDTGKYWFDRGDF